MRRALQVAVVALVCAFVAIASGCSSSVRMSFDAEGGSYTSSAITAIAEDREKPAFMGTSVDEAPDLRHEALTDLRSKEGEAAELASFLTKEFPGENRGVPYHGELATVDGTVAWVVLEVWGPVGGTLDLRRIWVFSRDTGDVMLSAGVSADVK